MTRLTQSVALACGTAGAFVDVSSYANLLDGTTRSWGRQSEFEDTAPGTFSFTLDNSDGRFNPGSTTLATPVTEGMQVCWQLGSRLVAGTILAIEPSFPEAESAWAQVTITCDDMLGNAARHELGGVAELLQATSAYYWWPMDDPAGSASANSGIPGLTSLGQLSSGVTFGGTAVPGVETTQAIASDSTGGASVVGLVYETRAVLETTSTTAIGTWGAWFTLLTDGVGARVTVQYDSLGVTSGDDSFYFGVNMDSGTPRAFVFSSYGVPVVVGEPHYYSADVSIVSAGTTRTLTVAAYIDGVAIAAPVAIGSYVGAAPSAAQVSPTRVSVTIGVSVATPVSAHFGHLTYTPFPIHLEVLRTSTSASRLSALAGFVPEITLDTLPTLSSAPYGAAEFDGSALDGINDVIRAEQGAIYSTTTGTLTAPVEKVTVRARDRVADVDYTFNVETEASGGTDFIRDITNMVQTVTVDGSDTSATYTDTTLADRVGSKNVSETVPLRDYLDLYTWGTDRIFRGANVALRAASLTIDALTTPTDRTADLLALVPGDRIQLTGLPSSLGFTTWDGWLLGAEEQHSLTEHTFTLYLQPVLPDPIILDTDYLTAGGNLSLTSNITNSATSISVTSSDGSLFTTGADLPQKIRVESECMNVTAVSGASSPQTFTVTRGVTDPVTGLATTAVSHLAAVTLELADYNVLAF